MKSKWTERIIPYFWIIVIVAAFIVSFYDRWYWPQVVAIYLQQAMIWFPVVSAMLLLALCSEVNFAVGEQIALGVCLAGIFKNELDYPLWGIVILIMLVMVLISAIFSIVYHISNIRFLWISIAFKLLFSEIVAAVKSFIRPAEVNNWNTILFEMILTAVCAAALLLYLNCTVLGRRLSLGIGRKEADNRKNPVYERVKISAFLVAGMLVGMTAMLYFFKSGSTTVVQGQYLSNTLLQVLGICGIYRLSRKNFLIRALLGSFSFVLLRAIEQKLGFGSREDIIISGVLFLFAAWQIESNHRSLRSRGGLEV